MVKGLGGLQRLLSRRGPSSATSSPTPALTTDLEDDLDPEELGPPPVLRPAAIFQQPLYDPNEITPAWLRRRPAPDPAPTVTPDPSAGHVASPAIAVATDRPKPAKRTRRSTDAATAKAASTPRPARPRTRRASKPAPGTPEG